MNFFYLSDQKNLIKSISLKSYEKFKVYAFAKKSYLQKIQGKNK